MMACLQATRGHSSVPLAMNSWPRMTPPPPGSRNFAVPPFGASARMRVSRARARESHRRERPSPISSPRARPPGFSPYRLARVRGYASARIMRLR